MADIAAVDVSYFIDPRKLNVDGFRWHTCIVSFGDGALTYPAGGVPLTSANFGLTTINKSWLEGYDMTAATSGIATAKGVIPFYDDKSFTVRLYKPASAAGVSSGLVEVAAGGDATMVSQVSLRLSVIGYK